MAIGRPREFDRDAALDAAMRLFWERGFASASMADLCHAMHIRSPSLYAAFGSKEALYLEAIGRYVGNVGPAVWDRLADGATAREGVASLLTAASKTLPLSEGAPAGCMAMLAAVGDAWPDTITQAARTVRLESLGQLRSRMRAAVLAGEIGAKTDIDRLSRFYLGVVQGMAVQARDGASEAELKDIAEAAMAAWPAV